MSESEKPPRPTSYYIELAQDRIGVHPINNTETSVLHTSSPLLTTPLDTAILEPTIIENTEESTTKQGKSTISTNKLFQNQF